MIPFKKLSLEDKATIETYTLAYAPPNCDLAFANMFCWQAQFHTEWAIVEECLAIRFRIDGGERVGYMHPLGPCDFLPVLKKLDVERWVGLTAEAAEKIRTAYPDAYAFDANRDFADYVYRVDDLRNLEGSAYKSKRNHINRFEAAYDYRFEALGAQHAEACLELEKKWRKNHDKTDLSSANAEEEAMHRAFENFDALGLKGGILYVKEQPVAFTYGSPINRDTFCIHVEKADTSFDGAFTMINREFLKTLPPEYIYVDREEDLGLDGLRQAKLSYHPTLLQPKFTALRLTEETRQIKKLWMEVFGDEEAFVDTFLVRFYDPTRFRGVYENDRLISMLHLIPVQTDRGAMTYIYAVATDPACRNKGLATQLLTDLPSPAFLITTEELIPFYEKLGFSRSEPIEIQGTGNFDFTSGDSSTEVFLTYSA